MSIFPHDDLLAKEMETWKAFGDNLREEERTVFNKMIRDCYRHLKAINLKGDRYATESVMMSMILTQQQMIEFLLTTRK